MLKRQTVKIINTSEAHDFLAFFQERGGALLSDEKQQEFWLGASPVVTPSAVTPQVTTLAVEAPEESASQVALPSFLSEDSPTFFSFEQERTFSRQELESALERFDLLTEPSFRAPSKEDFFAKFQKVQDAIEQGQIQKAVPVAMMRSNHSFSPLPFLGRLLSSLRATKSQGWVYGFWDLQQGVLGFTPELLFRKEGLSLQSMALAGTSTSSVSLEQSSKEKKEHELVVQGILKLLAQWGVCESSQTFSQSFLNLYHLRTDLFCDLNQDLPISDLLKVLHPTAALGVFPLEQRSFLKSLRDSCPEFLGSPFVFQRGDLAQAFVSIRNIEFQAEESVIACGCGVIKESSFEQEWNEVNLKLRQVLKMFGFWEAF